MILLLGVAGIVFCLAFSPFLSFIHRNSLYKVVLILAADVTKKNIQQGF